MQTANRLPGILEVDGNLAGASQVPAHEGIVKQLALRQNAKLKWQIQVQDRDVERRKMVHDVHVRLGSIDLIQALHGYRCANGPQDHPGPQTGKAMLNTAVAIKEG